MYARTVIFDDCVQTMGRKCRQIQKQVPGIHLQLREQIVEVPIVIDFVEVPQFDRRDHCAGSRVDVHYVDEECSSSHEEDR